MAAAADERADACAGQRVPPELAIWRGLPPMRRCGLAECGGADLQVPGRLQRADRRLLQAADVAAEHLLPVAGLHLGALLLELGQGDRGGRLLHGECLQLDGGVGDRQVLPGLQLGVGGLVVCWRAASICASILRGDLDQLLRALR